MKIYCYHWQNGGYFSNSKSKELVVDHIYTEMNNQYLATKSDNTYSIGVMDYVCQQFSTYKKLTDEQLKKLNSSLLNFNKTNYRYRLRK